ncbi:MAG: transposase [Bryobacterales bacterium]|nr:transposase [Bryobacterales bacterium]MEB2363704.1 transposase [Bryobacterales bacterium]
MTESTSEDKARAKTEQWRERMAELQSSGQSVKQFCKERGLSSWSFYKWRKQLQEAGPVRFALVERRTGREQSASNGDLEVVFATGERLRIQRGVDGATLRTVIEALRG